MMLTGRNVRLRELRKEDLDVLTKIGNEEEVLINLTTKLPNPMPNQVSESWYEEYIKEFGQDFVQFAIEKMDGTVIGKCGTMMTDWKNANLAVWIFVGGPENRSKGYGSEALGLLVDFIFNEMNMNRVQLMVFGFNERAITSYKKIGFVQEGVLKQEIFRGGKYVDVYIMSIIKSDYDMRQRG